MQIAYKRFFITAVLAVSTLFTIDGCHNFFITPSEANLLKFKGPLTVGLQQDIYSTSLEKDLIANFAKTQGIQIKFLTFGTSDEALELLKTEKIDLAFPRTPVTSNDFHGHYSMVYDDLQLSVVCAGNFELAEKLYIPDNFLYAVRSKNFTAQFDHLSWVHTTKPATELNKNILSANKNCFLTDARLANKNLLNNPKLKKLWTSSKAEAVSWITRQDLSELNQLIHFWFQNLVRNNQIRKFWDRYESVDFKMSVLEQKRFQKDVLRNLPKWRRLFERNAKENEIPWTLLAAVSYQESKWQEDAISYTGVKGLMQLTRSTAKHLGITDREDPKESIRGGAFYLRYLYDKTRADLPSYERWAQALSAYNIGWAHLRDARKLAQKLNFDANRWSEFKKILPLLNNANNKNYLADLTFGAARGDETVEFVDQTLGYTELLNGLFTRRSRTSQDF